MKIQNFVSRIFGPRPKPLDETVSYEDQNLQSRYLGSIPRDYHSYSSWGAGYESCGPNGCSTGGRGVYRDTPVYEPDGKPRVDATTERIQAKAHSVPLFGALGAAGGGALGFGVGALVANLANWSTGLTGGVLAGVGGLAAGVAAAGYAAGDRVRLEWREQPINEKRLAGYHHSVSTHYDTKCRTTKDSKGNESRECWQEANGYDHSFSPDVRYWQVGTHIAPKVVHFQDDGSWTPEPDPVEKDKADSNPPVGSAAQAHLAFIAP